jgi:hypothetical protein
MAKKRKNTVPIRNTNDLNVILNDISNRLIQLENFAALQSKLLNANILRIAAIVDILIEKKILTNKKIDKKSEEIIKEIKEKAKEYQKSDEQNALASLLQSDDFGNA